MKTFPIIVLAASLVFSAIGFADSPAAPTAWMGTSQNGSYLFKMVPEEVKLEDNREVGIQRQAFGVAYSLSEKGELNELWRTEGWYAFEGRISDDGKYFVRFGPWADDLKGHTDLAIAFYDQGKLVKEYQVRHLIKDAKALDYSTSHYRWRPVKQTDPTGFLPGDPRHFHLVMADKTTYVFEIPTGDIVWTDTDPGARNGKELWKEEQAEVALQGQALLEKSPFRKDFEEHFVISEGKQMTGTYSSCSLEGPSWSASLTPKNKLAHPAKVDVVFPIKGDHAEATPKPQEMIGAMEKAFQHPFVAERFKNGATGLRMRTQGDRLHWDTRELREFIKQIKGSEPDDQVLRHWVYAIIDQSTEPRHRDFYLNTQTGELIYEEGHKRPPVIVLLDAKGERVGKSD